MRTIVSTPVLVLAALGGAAFACVAGDRERLEGDRIGDADGGTSSIAAGAQCGVADRYASDVPPSVLEAFAREDGSGDPPEVYEPRAGGGLPEDWHTLTFVLRSPGASWLEVTLRVGDVSLRSIGPADKVGSAASEHWRSQLLPSAMWRAASCVAEQKKLPIAWTVRALTEGASAPSAAAEGSIAILPLTTGADVTYWEIQSGVTRIARLKASAATKQEIVGGDRCVGCHATTPDGLDLIYQVSLDPGDLSAPGLPPLPQDPGSLPSVDGGAPPPPPSLDGGFPLPPSLDGGFPPPPGAARPGLEERLVVVRPSDSGELSVPSYVTPAVAELLDVTCLARPSVSSAAWAEGGRFAAVAVCGGEDKGQLGLLRLDAPSDPLRIVERDGDARFAAEPAFSPTGDFVVYTSTKSAEASAGLPLSPTSDYDLYRVPLDLTRGVVGGAASPIEGASDPDTAEYHPTVSPDGALVAFTRGVAGASRMGGEIWIAHVAGGPAWKLIGDDDPSLSDLFRGPFRNSWPRFTPEVIERDGESHYTLAFSSQRGPGALVNSGAPATRMFFAFLKRTADGRLERTGMVLIPGQTFDADNRTVDARPLSSVRAVDPVK